MYYFLNESIPRFCSGIEHAEFKRLALFKAHQVPAKIVTAAYSRDAAENLARYHVDPQDYVNLYDYFCANVAVPSKPLTVQDLKFPADVQVTTTDADTTVTSGDWTCQTIHSQAGRVDTSDHFDGDGQLVRRDFYDTRGFLGFSQFFATADDAAKRYLALETFYSHTGRIGVEITYRQRDAGVVVTGYRLQHADGRQWHLMNTQQAYTVFLDCLNQDDGEGDTFISDRSNHTNRPMINMTTKARKLEHFHNIHFADYHDPMSRPLTYPSIGESDLLSRTDMVITPTHAQAHDMATRLRTQVPIVAIPVGSVAPAVLAQPHIPMAKRQRGQILIVARMYYEKHLDDALWAFKRAHDQLSWLTLTIYGYGDGATDHRDEKLLHKIVDEQHLADCVTFAGYTNDIGAVYDQSQVLLLSSRYEGFVLAILEAAAHGVPTVSYDTHYGPAELIQPGVSGELLPYGDVNGLGDALIKTFSTPERLAQLSAGAYARAADFSQARVWARWRETVIDTE